MLNLKEKLVVDPDHDGNSESRSGASHINFTSVERVKLAESGLAELPFQLLPNAVHKVEALEATLASQEELHRTWGDSPSICVVPFGKYSLTSLVQLRETLDIQSYRNFTLLQRQPGKSLAETLSQVEEEFVLLVPAGVRLHPSALFILAKEVSEISPYLAYWNHVLLDSEGKQARRYLRRSSLSPYSMLSRNVLGETLLVETGFLESTASAAERTGVVEEALPWMLATHCLAASKVIGRLGLALSYVSEEQKFNHFSLRVQDVAPVLKAFCSGSGIPVSDFEQVNDQTELCLRPIFKSDQKHDADPAKRRIQVIIPFKDQAELTLNCLKVLAAQKTAADLDVTLVNNRSNASELARVRNGISGVQAFYRIQVIDADYPFNFARLNNDGLEQSDSPYVLFMNNDVLLDRSNANNASDAIAELRSWCSLPDVGLVGGKLIFPGTETPKRIQHAGIDFSCWRPSNVTEAGHYTHVVREVDAVTLGFAMAKRSVLAKLGGLDEIHCPNGFGDALFGKRAKESGYRVLYTPFAEALHFESKSRGVRSEELELWELAKSGVPIADLYGDFIADNQPMWLNLGVRETQRPFERLASRIQASPKLSEIADRIAAGVFRLKDLLRGRT